MYRDIKIISGHVHSAHQVDPEALKAVLLRTGTDMANIAACAHSRALSLTPQALAMRATM